MSKFLKYFVFAVVAGSLVAPPAWADRYGRPGNHGHGQAGHGWKHGHHGGHGRNSHNNLGWTVGILAGTAAIIAATNQPRVHYPPVVHQPVYVPAPVVPAPAYRQPQSYWYYCAQADAYYPYVASCPTGWMKVLPH